MNNQNYINHIALVLDASLSMSRFDQELIKVADNQIAYLARRSKELDQETRVTVYTFNSPGVSNMKGDIQCLIYDKDVLRMPSIKGLYHPSGMTPLIDATKVALDDLALTPEKYGEHAFLIYVLTDGEENCSKTLPKALQQQLESLADNWTIAAFVPNANGVHEAKKFGFSKDNISVWDADTAAGYAEAGEKIRQTSETFMQNRTKGIKGTKSLFSLAAPSLSKVAKNLTALHFGQYRLLDVAFDERIDEFVESNLNRPYKLGEAYYQLMKREEIQPQKQVAIFDPKKSVVYTGQEARDLLGLPDEHVKVSPSDHTYQIFVQSTSVNRKLIAGTRLLILS